MIKRQRDFEFMLKPLNKQCYMPLTTEIIKPAKLTCFKLFKKTYINTQLPIFNQDKKYYTPSFILYISYQHYRKQIQNYSKSFKIQQLRIAQQHNKMDQQLQNQNSKYNNSLQLPQVKRTKKYCGVCNIYYQQYFKHIKCYAHNKNVQNNTTNIYIQQLCKRYPRKIEIGSQKISSSFDNMNKKQKQNQDQNQVYKCRRVQYTYQKEKRKLIKKQSKYQGKRFRKQEILRNMETEMIRLCQSVDQCKYQPQAEANTI